VNSSPLTPQLLLLDVCFRTRQCSFTKRRLSYCW